MKFFTRERYLALQSAGEVAARAADADWEQAVEQYDAYLQTLRPGLTEAVRQLLDGFYLHDARVLSMGQRGDRFTVSLQLDVPPQELLTIAGWTGPTPTGRALCGCRAHLPTCRWWLYEEFRRAETPDQHLIHAIMLSNSWELDLPFRDVHLATAYPMLPRPRERHKSEVPMPASAG
jgi:hypothetical protein